MTTVDKWRWFAVVIVVVLTILGHCSPDGCIWIPRYSLLGWLLS
jgi:hypothetical protein